MTIKTFISQSISVFHGMPLPESGALLVGYSALIHEFSLRVPLPNKLSAIGEKHKRYEQGIWSVYTPRYTPENTLHGHLTFALKYDGIDLAILKALFNVIDSQEIVKIILKEPTGSYSRRLWFLYEWLQDKKLNLPDATRGNFVDVLDSDFQYPGPSSPSKRHRVRNNLPGVRGFCPLIRRTHVLDQFIGSHLQERAYRNVGSIHPDVLRRAAAFLLLKDSRASFAIEGESPSQTRAERWGKAIGQAGLFTLSKEELKRLQEIVIGDTRFIKLGYRQEGGFIGTHDRVTGTPLPDHISAREKDLIVLIDSLIETSILLSQSNFDPVLAATVVAFGFVFIHPFEDGNGRLHRYLLHHVLAEMKFTPKGIIFPISAVILERIEKYKDILESYSRPRLELVEWRPTNKGNVEVLNETIDLYRYFDVTNQAELLYECVQQTIDTVLPEEVSYLKKHDEMKLFLNSYVDMPDRLASLLIRFLSQGNGKLSKRAKTQELNSLTEKEVQVIEERYTEIFGLEN